MMGNLLIIITLASCQTGDRLLDLSQKLPNNVHVLDLLVSVGAILCAAIYLQRRCAVRFSAVLQWKTDIRSTSACKRRPILHQAEPAKYEVENSQFCKAECRVVIAPGRGVVPPDLSDILRRPDAQHHGPTSATASL